MNYGKIYEMKGGGVEKTRRFVVFYDSITFTLFLREL